MPLASNTPNRVRKLQRALYLSAKKDPRRRFHALYDKLYRIDVMQWAWSAVRANRGAAGIDGVTVEDIEIWGAGKYLHDLSEDLQLGTYRPQPGRRVWIPKPGKAEKRPLSIPTVRDRIVQAALKIVIEPVFEADFLPCSHGFRPRRSTHDALQVLVDEAFTGRRWVVETDIASCFDDIPHDGLLTAVAERICDGKVLHLVRMMLAAGVMEQGIRRNRITGTPQGGVVSPLLANIYLHRLNTWWSQNGQGRLCRYADDLVVLCRSEKEASQALFDLHSVLGSLGLRLKASKTRQVYLEEGGPGFDFLGFHHRWVRARGARNVTFLARWPSRAAMQKARDRIRDLTARSRLVHSTEGIIDRLNRFLRGWVAYFRYGNSTRCFDRIRSYAVQRLCSFVGKRHKGSTRLGWFLTVHKDRLHKQLADFNGLVRAPRPNRPWRICESRR